MRAVRRVAFSFWLAGSRLRRRRGSLLLVVLGLAAATAMLAAVLAGTTAAEDREVGRQVVQIPAKVRAVRVNWFSVGGQVAPYATLDRNVRRELHRALPEHATGTALYSESQLGGSGTLVGLGAVDDLGSWVRLRSGRLPRVCRPDRCEVLVIRSGGRLPNVPGLRLVPVGQGDLKTAALFGDAVPAEGLNQSTFVQHIARYHRPTPPPLVLANGVAALDRSPIDQARTAFQTGTFGFELTAPTDELRAAAGDAHVAGRRLLLLGGAAVALLLAFAVLVGARQRRDADALRARLRAVGVRRWQSTLVILVESLTAALAGTILGWVAGSAAAAAIAGRSGEPFGDLLRHSVLTGRGLTIALVVGLAAGLILALALTIAPVEVGGRAISPLDVAAVGAALAVVIALARGSANASELLASNDTGLVLLLLPALVGLVAAVAVARLLPLALRGLERVVPKDALTLRLAALGRARRPGYASVAVAFVVVSVGFALFASTYRSTLETGQREQAAFAIPADEVLSEDLSQLVPVRAIVTPEVERSLGVQSSRVTRLAGNIAGAQVTGITVLGVPRSTLPGIDGWRSDFASASPAELARKIDPGRSVALRGPTIPRDARRLSVALTVRGTLVGLVAYVAARDGSFVPIRLARNEGPRPRVLVARVPSEARGGKLVAFRFDPPPKLIERGSNSGGPAVGTVVLGPPRVDGRALTDYGDWVGTTGVAGLTRHGALRFGLTLTNEVDTYVRPRQPTDGLQIPAIVSPLMAQLAGPDRVFGVVVAGEPLVFRVAAVARRFPGILESQTSDFVVVDQPALAAALNVASPGFGFPTEQWLDVPGSRRAAVEAKLREPPFTALAVSSQSQREASLRREPIARGALAMLEAAAITAIVLALLALVLGAVSERRDEAAELFDLEAQGVAPASLRRQLRLRASMAGLAGALGGAVTGLVLSLLVVRFVELTANATVPEPPLELAPDWPLILAAAAVAAVAGAVLVALATHRAFRGRVPARYGEAT